MRDIMVATGREGLEGVKRGAERRASGRGGWVCEWEACAARIGQWTGSTRPGWKEERSEDEWGEEVGRH